MHNNFNYCRNRSHAQALGERVSLSQGLTSTALPQWEMFRANQSGGRLTKLRYVCSMCATNCIDEHGFAQHLLSQKHMENELHEEERRLQHGPKAYDVDPVSARFEESFLERLATRHLDQRVLAHEVYHEAFDNDRPMHELKKTCWGSFGQFIASLRDRGRLGAERDAKGWLVCLRSGELGPGGALPEGAAMPPVPRPSLFTSSAASSMASRRISSFDEKWRYIAGPLTSTALPMSSTPVAG